MAIGPDARWLRIPSQRYGARRDLIRVKLQASRSKANHRGSPSSLAPHADQDPRRAKGHHVRFRSLAHPPFPGHPGAADLSVLRVLRRAGLLQLHQRIECQGGAGRWAGHLAHRTGQRAPAQHRTNAPADAEPGCEAVGHAGNAARHAGRHRARACAAGRRRAHEPGSQRRSAAAPVCHRPAVCGAAQPGRQRQPRPACRARHELGDVCAEPAPGHGHAPGAAGHRRHGAGAQGRGRPVARTAVAAPPGADAALQREGLSQQGQPERRRYRGLLQGQRGAVPRTRAGAYRIHRAGPAGAETGHLGPGGRPAPLLRRERQPLHGGRGAPRQPHSGCRRQGHARSRAAEGPRQGRGAAGAGAQVAGAVCRDRQEEQQRSGQCRTRRGPRLLRPRRHGQALRGCGVRDEARRDQQRGRDRLRLSHHHS